MMRTRVMFAALVGLAAAGITLAGDTPPVPLALAQGMVDKVEKDSLTMRPRGPDGRFQKSLVLKVTGTSNFTIITDRKGKGKMVLVQKSAGAKDMQTGQHIAVIYAPEKDGGVLLSAVAQPAKAP